jgi:FkbM family methyltransferase
LIDVFLDPAFEAVFRAHPLVLVDVGARGGPRPNWRPAARHLRYIGFEPDRDEFARLVAGGAITPEHRILNIALHNRPGPVRLHVARSGGLSSIFEPNREFIDKFPDAGRFDIVDVRTIEADRLDHQLTLHGIDGIDFIKADTQGSEILVLEGASEALRACVIGVEVEVGFSEFYIDQPLFGDVDRFMRNAGFSLFDIRPCYWKRAIGQAEGGPRGQLIWGDALYFKSPAGLAETARAFEGTRRTATVLKAISVALLYGYADYALELTHDHTLPLEPDERARIDRHVRGAAARRNSMPEFPGRRGLAGAIHRLWKLVRERDHGWSVSGAEIGNVD